MEAPLSPGQAAGRGARDSRSRRWLWLGLVTLVILATVATVAAWGIRVGAADQHGVRLLRFTIHSRILKRSLPATALVPPGAQGRPLVVFLHGKGPNGQNSNLSENLFAALARLGPRAPVIVFPNGGEDSYWHNRSSGAWGDYVVGEVIPAAVSALAADPRRVAIGGISMGGFGALDLARLHPGRFCAIGGHSAALWTSGGDTAPGAFDGTADFARHDIIAAAARGNPYRRIPVWMDVGTRDPFRAADTRMVGVLRRRHVAIEFHLWSGGHDSGYWSSHIASYLAFYARVLARCG